MIRAVTVPSDDLLRRMPLFRRLSVDDRARVAAVARLVHHVRGTHVFDEGDDAHAFLAVVEGRVKVYKSTPAGKELILEIFGPGDPLGAVAVYEGAPFPASALALDDVAIVPGAVTTNPEMVTPEFRLGDHTFAIPVIASAMDGVVDPQFAAKISRLGGMAVLNLDGVWTR